MSMKKLEMKLVSKSFLKLYYLNPESLSLSVLCHVVKEEEEEEDK